MGYQEHTLSASAAGASGIVETPAAHPHFRRAGVAVLWVGGASILYLMLGLPLAFASMYITRYLALIFAAPTLPAVLFMRLGLHPIAAVVVTFLGYWAAGYGVIEWRAHRRRAERYDVLIAHSARQ